MRTGIQGEDVPDEWPALSCIKSYASAISRTTDDCTLTSDHIGNLDDRIDVSFREDSFAPRTFNIETQNANGSHF